VYASASGAPSLSQGALPSPSQTPFATPTPSATPLPSGVTTSAVLAAYMPPIGFASFSLSLKFSGLPYASLFAAVLAPSTPLAQVLSTFLACTCASPASALFGVNATLVSASDAANPALVSGFFPAPVLRASDCPTAAARARALETSVDATAASAPALRVLQDGTPSSVFVVSFSVKAPSAAALSAAVNAGVPGAMSVALDPAGSINGAAASLGGFFNATLLGTPTNAWPALAQRWSVLARALSDIPITQLTMTARRALAGAATYAAVSVSAVSAVATASNAAAPAASSTPSSPNASYVNAAAVVGGVLGAALLAAVAVAVALRVRRRRREAAPRKVVGRQVGASATRIPRLGKTARQVAYVIGDNVRAALARAHPLSVALPACAMPGPIAPPRFRARASRASAIGQEAAEE
jgi:hypothetical protein